MSISRRNFIKTGAGAAALLSTSQLLMSCSSSPQKLQKFGLQLYTLRDVLPADPVGVLKQVSTMGYKQIESYEGDKGMFWGMTNKEFKKLMDELGMNLISSHTNIRQDFEKKAAEAAEIGMKYLIDPWEGPQKSIDDFKRIAETFNEKGAVCKKNGIRFAYHNHDYSFKEIDGRIPQDVMMQETDPALVDFEMDIYWVVTAGQDPLQWFKKYPNRWSLCHIKDRAKGIPLSEKKNVSCVLGTGEIDWKTILKAAQKHDMKYYIVEQEAYDNMSSLEASRLDAEYLKKLEF